MEEKIFDTCIETRRWQNDEQKKWTLQKKKQRKAKQNKNSTETHEKENNQENFSEPNTVFKWKKRGIFLKRIRKCEKIYNTFDLATYDNERKLRNNVKRANENDRWNTIILTCLAQLGRTRFP